MDGLETPWNVTEEDDANIPDVSIIERAQYDAEFGERVLPYELRLQQMYPLRVLWLDGRNDGEEDPIVNVNDAIESTVRIEDRLINDEGYVIAISYPVIGASGEPSQRDLFFSKDGTLSFKYEEANQEVTITDVGYFVRSEAK